MSNQPLTLNDLLNYYTKSVGSGKIPAMWLIGKYKPTTEDEMRNVINKHSPYTIEECVTHALKRQGEHGCSYSREEIHNFIDNLMVADSLKGTRAELAILDYLQLNYPEFKFSRTTGLDDEAYAVDIYATQLDGYMRGGIQVKPTSYRDGKGPQLEEARESNKTRNEAFIKKNPQVVKVAYFYYNKKTLNFENIKRIAEKYIKFLGLDTQEKVKIVAENNKKMGKD